MQAETKRQLEHMVPVAFALLLRWIPLWLAALSAALSVVYGAFVSPRLFPRTLREDERRRGFSPGKITYGAVVLALILVFREERFYIVVGAWALLGIGDGMANLVGRTWGRAKVPWNRQKSWEGVAGFVVFSALAAAFLIWWVSARPESCHHFRLLHSLLLGLAMAVVGGLVETVKFPYVNDNVTVPAAGALVLFVLTL